MIDLWICEDWPKCPHFPNMSSLCWLKTRSSVCSKYKKTRTHTTVRKWHFNEKDAEVSPQPYLICHMQLDETQQTHIHTHTLLPHLLTAGTLVLLTLDSTTLSLSLSLYTLGVHTYTYTQRSSWNDICRSTFMPKWFGLDAGFDFNSLSLLR